MLVEFSVGCNTNSAWTSRLTSITDMSSQSHYGLWWWGWAHWIVFTTSLYMYYPPLYLLGTLYHEPISVLISVFIYIYIYKYIYIYNIYIYIHIYITYIYIHITYIYIYIYIYIHIHIHIYTHIIYMYTHILYLFRYKCIC